MKEYMARVERLRDAAVEPFICYDEFHLYFYEQWAQNEALGSMEKRYADALTHAIDHLTPVIEPEEMIVGRAAHRLSEQEQETWQTLRREIVEPMDMFYGQGSHMAIDYELLLNEGAEGIIARIDGKLSDETDEKKRAFYELSRHCLMEMIRLSEKYASLAKAQAEACAEEGRRKELLSIAQACVNVPRKPAGSFYEAIQSVHFVSYCLSMNPFRPGHQQFQLGRPDRYLYPYYKADKASGLLSDDQAQLLMDCLAIQINNRVPHGLSSGYMLGGRDRKGNVIANELTMMGMQAIDDVHLVYPSVGLCVTRDTPDIYLEKAMDVLSHGRSHPAIFNDDIISEGLKYYGVEEARSHDYIHSTCVEITPCAASNVWVASPYTNMPQLLLDIMDREYDSFDQLVEALFARLDRHIADNFEMENRFRQIRYERTINPLLSCFVDDCIERGVDIERGGAKYNWIMPSFVGMANLVDSLYVVKKLVFEKKEMTIAQLKELTDSNFEDNELMRFRMLHGVDKYGNDVDEIDCYFGMIVDHIVEECKKHRPMFSEGRLIPSVFCWVMHERFGRQTGATPDGRRAGFPLGDGSGPCQGRERKGPTASILSSTKWSHKELIGGVAVNMKFSKKTFTEESCRKVLSLVKTYLARGGFEMQINVVDRDTLLRAQENPEQYRDLVVRIGGYSDYFVKISREMQEEVLLRTAHEV